MTEKDFHQAVRRLFHKYQYILVNSFVFEWESDFFSLTKTGTVYEAEMKVTRAESRKDFEKEKHLSSKMPGPDYFKSVIPKNGSTATIMPGITTTRPERDYATVTVNRFGMTPPS